jgi:hypothetical protein
MTDARWAAHRREREDGDHYHGCLIMDVPRSKDLYWRIEGVMAGMAEPPG